MTGEKKSPVAILVFVLFIVLLPIATLVFSKKGLDRYKSIRSEMRFLKDSIRVDFDQARSIDGAFIGNRYIRGKLVVAGFYNQACAVPMERIVEQMKKVQTQLSADDQKKILFVLHLGTAVLPDSAVASYRTQLEADSSQWKLLRGGTPDRYQIEASASCTTIALLDGRVSRKDTTNNYLKGPLLGDYYELKEEQEEEALLRHMAILMPAKKRKSIEYKAEPKLYQNNKDSTSNE